jgi:hypothetical protein
LFLEKYFFGLATAGNGMFSIFAYSFGILILYLLHSFQKAYLSEIFSYKELSTNGTVQPRLLKILIFFNKNLLSDSVDGAMSGFFNKSFFLVFLIDSIISFKSNFSLLLIWATLSL